MKSSSILEIPQFYIGQVVVAVVIVINSVVGMVDLAERTKYYWLHQLSDNRCPIAAVQND